MKHIQYYEFVDSLPEMSSKDEPTRRRALLLLIKLFQDDSIPLDKENAESFQNYIIKCILNQLAFEEIAKLIQVLIKRYPELIEVFFLLFPY